MRVSVFTSIYNRAHLLRYNLEALYQQLKGYEVDFRLADDGSDDDLDKVLEYCTKSYGWKAIKYTTKHFREFFNNAFNCPSVFYNMLTHFSEASYIIKVDPEFVFITSGFVQKSLSILQKGNPAIIMPLPHHVYEFEYNSLEDIKNQWKEYEYPTHINKNTAARSNVYYGCMFSREAYINLGGIDIRFGNGIGSEDDHFLDQWRRKYGSQNVISLVDEHGLHMWHGGFSGGVPQHLYSHVHKNEQLRRALQHTYPNGGKFYSVEYPDIPYQEWKNGRLVGEGVTRLEKGVNNDSRVIIGNVYWE